MTAPDRRRRLSRDDLAVRRRPRSGPPRLLASGRVLGRPRAGRAARRRPARRGARPLAGQRRARRTPSLDLCIHRGTALSLGTVEGDEIVCPYHGWRYGSDGACTRIPQLADPTRVPAKARATAFTLRRALRVRLGRARGAALGAARGSRARGSSLGDRLLRPVHVGLRRLAPGRELHRLRPLPVRPPGPARRSRSGPSCRATRSTTDGHVLRYEIVRPEAPANDDFPVFGNEVVEAPERRSRYELHLPYTIVLRLGWGGQAGMVYFFACRPEGPERTTGFLAIGRNYNLEQPDSRAAGVRGRDLRAGPAHRRVAAARAGAVRPRRRAAPHVRRGRGRLPAGDARERARAA